MDSDPVARARATFVTDDNMYGCAETSFVVLKDVYGLPDPADSSAAMALNGGIAYQGGMCGAITGAALAVGQLAGTRIEDHREAKRTARRLVMDVIADFEAAYGSTACRDLTGFDMRTPGEHDRFIESGVWRTTCADQIGFVVERLAALEAPEAWSQATATAVEDGTSTVPPIEEDGDTHHG